MSTTSAGVREDFSEKVPLRKGLKEVNEQVRYSEWRKYKAKSSKCKGPGEGACLRKLRLLPGKRTPWCQSCQEHRVLSAA